MFKHKQGNNIHEHGKQQKEWTGTHKLVLNLSQRLDLRSSDKHAALQNLIHYTWKNIRKEYINNKLKIIAPTWNDYSVSDI